MLPSDGRVLPRNRRRSFLTRRIRSLLSQFSDSVVRTLRQQVDNVAIVLRQQVRWPVVFVLLVVLLLFAYLALAENEDIAVRFPFLVQHLSDKQMHFYAFAVVSCFVYYLWLAPEVVARSVALARTLVLCVLLAVVSEWMQGWLSPHRPSDWFDVPFNIGGTCIGVTFAVILDLIMLQRCVRRSPRRAYIHLRSSRPIPLGLHSVQVQQG